MRNDYYTRSGIKFDEFFFRRVVCSMDSIDRHPNSNLLKKMWPIVEKIGDKLFCAAHFFQLSGELVVKISRIVVTLGMLWILAKMLAAITGAKVLVCIISIFFCLIICEPFRIALIIYITFCVMDGGSSPLY